MNDDILVTKAQFNECLARAWDAAVASMVYPDGSKVELLSNSNPYRKDAK